MQATDYSEHPASTEAPLGRAKIASGLRQGVMVLTLHAPPVNVLGPDLRAELVEILAFAFAEPSVRGVVLTGHGPQFSAGCDLAEWTAAEPDQTPTSVAALCQMIEAAPKPVVVALQGDATGAAVELALAAHRRIALASVRLCLPEVRLGLMPGAGGTQRLPRLVGAEPAIEILTRGEPVSAPTALAMGLLDQITEDGLLATAVEAAIQLAKADLAPFRTLARRDGFRNGAAFGAAIGAAKARLVAEPNPVEAPARIVEVVEAAWLLPIEQGIAFEAAALRALKLAPEPPALKHAFLAEARALRLPQHLAESRPGLPQSLAFWGAGREATELAARAIAIGLQVTLGDTSRERLVAALERIAALQESAVQQGQITAEERDADWARLVPNTRQKALEGADLVFVDGLAGPVTEAGVSGIVALGAAAPVGGIALQPAAAAGQLAEMAVGQGAPIEPQVRIVGLARKLGWKLVCTGPGGPIERALRATLARVLAEFEAKGVDRVRMARCLSAAGLGVPYSARVAASGAAPDPDTADLVPASLAALANRGARLWREGALRQLSDVDAVSTLGGLVPRWMGGPMYWADQRGLLALRADLRRRAETLPDLYAPDPLFDTLLADGRGLFQRKAP